MDSGARKPFRQLPGVAPVEMRVESGGDEWRTVLHASHAPVT